jgi:hypothetical protein
LRTCQAWEKGEQPEAEPEDYENGDMMETEDDMSEGE